MTVRTCSLCLSAHVSAAVQPTPIYNTSMLLDILHRQHHDEYVTSRSRFVADLKRLFLAWLTRRQLIDVSGRIVD